MDLREELAALEVSHKEEVDKNFNLEREIKKIQKDLKFISSANDRLLKASNEVQEKNKRLSTQNDLLQKLLQNSKAEVEDANFKSHQIEIVRNELNEEKTKLKTVIQQQVRETII